MKAEILCIGTELLHGDIVNTNAVTISKALASIGIDVHHQSVVGDNPRRMKAAIALALSRSDVVITTGGLGPTQDDITKEAFAKCFGLPMIFDQGSMDHVKHIYSRFQRDMPENNLRQAYFPKGARILDNPNGTANACILEDKVAFGKRKIAVLLPGPPYEMNPILTKAVIPYLHRYSRKVVQGVKVAVTQLGESRAEMMILDLIEKQKNPTIAPYAGKGRVVFRVTAKALTQGKCQELMAPVVQELLHRFGENAYILEEGDTDQMVGRLLLKNNVTFATAESCTGGMVASKLVSTPGISEVFLGGFICYSNELKQKFLKVSSETLKSFGAVSEETVREMAKGAAEVSGAKMGLATTGIAGPDGGTAEKPVGTVYTCIYYRGEYHVSRLNLTGERDIIRERGANQLIEQVRRILNSQDPLQQPAADA